MLTNEDLNGAKDTLATIAAVYPFFDSAAMIGVRAIDELLFLRTLPAMAEVDALVREIDPAIDLNALDLNPSPVRRLANLARELGGHIGGRDANIKDIAEKFCSDEIRVPDPSVWSHIWAIERKFEKLLLACESERKRAEEAEVKLVEFNEMLEGIKEGVGIRLADLTRENGELWRLMKWTGTQFNATLRSLAMDRMDRGDEEGCQEARDIIELCEKGGSDGNT